MGRDRNRVFASKDEIFCLFEGALDNLPSLRQQYGLAKNVNEALLLIEAYKALRDRAPYPASHVVGHLSGDFAFIVYDHATATVFVATVRSGPESKGKSGSFFFCCLLSFSALTCLTDLILLPGLV